MKKVKLIFFERGQQAEHEGVTYIAELQKKGGLCAGCAFTDKLAVERVNLKWYQKIADWWKASNRWKHFLFAIPLGAVCGAPFTTGVGLGMEVKDHLYGNRADFVDFLLTAVGGVIGHGVMLVIGLDYVIGYLINLI